jgi:hypothetical protein
LNSLKFFLLVPLLSVGISCTKKDKNNDNAPVSVVETKDPVKEAEAANFSPEASDGRLVQYASLDSVRGENTNYSKLHPKTAEFYGVASVDAVEYQHSLSDVKKLRNFTNFQEAIFEDELIVAVTEGCRQEGFTSIRTCLDEGIVKSGALVMQPVTPLGNPTNPNDPKHILDVANNTFGLIAVKVGNKNAYMGSCAGCHSSVSTMEKQNGQKVVYIDPKGDNTAADVNVSRDISPYLSLVKSKVENHNDPIWNSTPRGRAAGLLAAQYNLLRERHGSAYYATDEHIKEYSKNFSAKRAVDSGWLLAFASFGSAADIYCDTDYENCQNMGLTDADIAIKTSRARLETFLPGGSRVNITDAIFASGNPLNIPTRSQRVTSLWPAPNSTMGYMNYMGNFTTNYTHFYIGNGWKRDAQYYLLAATSMAAVMPHDYELTLTQKWLNQSVDNARNTVNNTIKRTILQNYEAASTDYYDLRYKQSPAMNKDYAPTISVSELATAETYMQKNCYSCHKINVPQFSKAVATCGWGNHACVVDNENQILDTEQVDWDSYRTPSAIFAGNINSAIGTLPHSMTGVGYAQLITGDYLKQSPVRTQISGRKSLSRWDQLSWKEALSATPLAPRYAILSPIVDINGDVQPRKMLLTFDLDRNGTIGYESAVCKKTDVFNFSGKTMSCQETLNHFFGSSPRILGESAVVDRHASAVRPLAGDLEAVSKYMACVSREICRITDGTKYLTVHGRATGTYNCTAACDQNNSGSGGDGFDGSGGGYDGSGGGYDGSGSGGYDGAGDYGGG